MTHAGPSVWSCPRTPFGFESLGPGFCRGRKRSAEDEDVEGNEPERHRLGLGRRSPRPGDLPDTDGTDDVNYRDFDDDGDGIDTPDEDVDEDGDPTNDDSDGDGTPDYLDAIDDSPPPVDEDIEVMQLITPNGDGDNDFLWINGLDKVRGSTLQIYNRWGVKVYDGTNYNNINNIFDGRSRGRSTRRRMRAAPTRGTDSHP